MYLNKAVQYLLIPDLRISNMLLHHDEHPDDHLDDAHHHPLANIGVHDELSITSCLTSTAVYSTVYIGLGAQGYDRRGDQGSVRPKPPRARPT